MSAEMVVRPDGAHGLAVSRRRNRHARREEVELDGAVLIFSGGDSISVSQYPPAGYWDIGIIHCLFEIEACEGRWRCKNHVCLN